MHQSAVDPALFEVTHPGQMEKQINVEGDHAKRSTKSLAFSHCLEHRLWTLYSNMSTEPIHPVHGHLRPTVDTLAHLKLSEEQSQLFENLKGKKLDVDLSKLPMPGRG